jgi:hypothetical protein
LFPRDIIEFSAAESYAKAARGMFDHPEVEPTIKQAEEKVFSIMETVFCVFNVINALKLF